MRDGRRLDWQSNGGLPSPARGGRYSPDPLHRPRHLGADNLDALGVVVGPGDPGLAMLGREPPRPPSSTPLGLVGMPL